MHKPFDAGQERFLAALTEALFDGVAMVITPAEVVANIQAQFALIRGDQARSTAIAMAVLQVVLGPRFVHVDVATRRRRIERRLMTATFDPLQDLARLRGIILAGYYGHWLTDADGAPLEDQTGNPVLGRIDFVVPSRRTRPAARAIERRPDDLPDAAIARAGNLPAEVDVIVIGSGAGGAVAAHNLARHGYRVLVVERGPHVRSTSIHHHEARMVSRLYHQGALQFSTDNDIVLFQGSAVGGSTLINNGICLRFDGEDVHPDAPDVLGAWEAAGAPVDAARLHAAYDAVERRIGIARPHPTVGPVEGAANGTHLLDAWRAFAGPGAPAWARAAPARWFYKSWGTEASGRPCVFCGYCNTGCPYGRRRGAVEAFLKPVAAGANALGVAHPLRILPDATVEKMLWRRGGGRRTATGVRVAIHGGGRVDIAARVGVVVAAGTMASTRILRASGVDDAGAGCSLNIACPVIARMPAGAPQRAWDEDQMTSYVDCGEFLLESHFQPPMSMATMVPGWFGDHGQRMRDYGRLVSAGVLFPADRRGRVHKHSMKFKLRDDDLARLRRALTTLCLVHFAGGAEEVYPALLKGQALARGMDAAAVARFFDAAIRDTDDVVLSSSHPQGGNAIHTDPDEGIVDPRLFLHNATNVMVTDASVFPSCIRVNAQLTTMAMAHYATATDPFVR